MALLRTDFASRIRAALNQPASNPVKPKAAVPAATVQPSSAYSTAPKPNTLVSPPATRFVDAKADALLGLKRNDYKTSASDTRVEQLQRDLMGLGYLPKDFDKNEGFGQHFGPITETALRKFQAVTGIPQSGVVDERTVAALAGRPIPPPPSVDDPAALVGLKRGDKAVPGDERIAALQKNLMERGYLPANFEKNSGYGKRFGELTEQAVEKLQRDWGLTPSGAIDEATAAALGSHGTAPDPQLRAAWAGHSRLGGASGPATVNPDGSMVQSFERGTISKAADGTVTVADLSGRAVESTHSGTSRTLDEANRSFVNQEGNTAYYQSFNGAPKPYGPNDCGPTSAVMVLSALGLTEHPTAAEAPHAIDAMRDAIFKTNTETSSTMGMYAVQQGLAAYGAESHALDVSKAKKDGTGLGAIDAALDAGHPVILGGTPSDAWAKELDKTKDYLDMGASGTGNFGHFVAVLGRTADGKYLLADPLSKRGTIEVSAAQIGTFLKTRGWGEAVEVYPAGAP